MAMGIGWNCPPGPTRNDELRLRCGHERHYRHDNSQCDEKTGNEAGNHGMMSQA